MIAIIGIYKIENKNNGKVYIGQSNNIERRFKEHLYKQDLYIEQIIAQEGENNFSFDILEECSIEELNEKEIYYIQLFDSYYNGYNFSFGGNCQSGDKNANAKLTEEDVIYIRTQYAKRIRTREVYEMFKNKITKKHFMNIWEGKSWTHIMPEVYTEENKKYYCYQSTNGELSPMAKFTNDEVLKIRERYVKETAQQIYKDYSDRCTLDTLKHILIGTTYKNVPIYKKKKKEWINR